MTDVFTVSGFSVGGEPALLGIAASLEVAEGMVKSLVEKGRESAQLEVDRLYYVVEKWEVGRIGGADKRACVYYDKDGRQQSWYGTAD